DNGNEIGFTSSFTKSLKPGKHRIVVEVFDGKNKVYDEVTISVSAEKKVSGFEFMILFLGIIILFISYRLQQKNPY
ncbi:MAG: hypothetical protein AB1779_12355, partial [Candidatus Thermoplasmatota archaeon]